MCGGKVNFKYLYIKIKYYEQRNERTDKQSKEFWTILE